MATWPPTVSQYTAPEPADAGDVAAISAVILVPRSCPTALGLWYPDCPRHVLLIPCQLLMCCTVYLVCWACAITWITCLGPVLYISFPFDDAVLLGMPDFMARLIRWFSVHDGTPGFIFLCWAMIGFWVSAKSQWQFKSYYSKIEQIHIFSETLTFLFFFSWWESTWASTSTFSIIRATGSSGLTGSLGHLEPRLALGPTLSWQSLCSR